MHKKKIFWSALIVFSLLFPLQGPAATKPAPRAVPPAEQPKMGGTLVFGLDKEFANPNPFIANSSIYQFVKETSYESLLYRQDDGKFVPHLAERYSVSGSGKEF